MSASPVTPEASADDGRVIAPRPESGLRLRAILLAIPLLACISYVSVYADMVSKTVQFGVLQLAPPAVAALFLLALVNRVITRLFRRELLSKADILVIYVMMLIGVMVSTRGMVERVIPPLAHLAYYGNDTNRFHEYITRYLPSWAVPFTPSAALQKPEFVERYFEGLRPGESIPYGVWVGPLFAWFVLMAMVILVFLAMATILRRRWMDEERLTFPLTRLPLAIIQDEIEGQPFLRNKLMWMGFTVAALMFFVNGMSVNFPSLPGVTVDYNLSQVFTQRPWSQMDGIRLWLSLAAIGFAYFLPNDLLFSLWFFFLLTRLQDAVAVMLGGEPMAIGTQNARIWTGYQAAGAYFIIVIAQLRIGWPHFRNTWRTAFERDRPGFTPLDDTAELMTYRAAYISLFAGCIGVIAWFWAAGMNPYLAAIYMGIYIFLVALIMTRSVAEAGILMTETSFLPAHLIRLVYPLQSLGAANLALSGMANILFARDLRGILFSPFMDNQKMAGELKVKQRSLLLPIVLAIVLAYIIGNYFFIKFHYTLGGINLYGYPNSNAQNMMNFSRSAIRGDMPPIDATAYGGFVVGLVVATALVWARAVFTWFPLHPLAYAIAPTWTMYVFSFPFFIAWVIKACIQRFGTIKLYRSLAPFMLGLVLGEFSMAVFWAIMNSLYGWNAPTFPWP